MQIGSKPVVPETQIRYCLYARKSTEQEDKQALSIDSQIKEMAQLAQRDCLTVVDVKREAHSSKEVGQRPVFNEMIEDLKNDKFNGILTWAPDRLSRNAGDLGSIVDLMDKGKLIEIRTFGQKFSNNPNEKFLLMILGSQAKLENDNKMINVKRGLRTRVEMGLWPSVPPTGYLPNTDRTKKCEMILDPDRHMIIKMMFEKVGYDGWSGRKVLAWLKEVRFVARSGKALSLSNLYLILKNPFYYGEFEYPKGSGARYKGKHDPIITKELFDLVQEKISLDRVVKMNIKEFAFTRLITCGLCGSGITADEKFKKQQNGNIHRYVYYGCTKARDKNCTCGHIREEELITQLEQLFDTVSLDSIGMKEQIKQELEQHQKFQMSVLGKSVPEQIKIKEIDIRNYAKYILRERTMQEKRELLSHLRSKLIMKNRNIEVAI
jgi:DNA invertase Pin-like site-specific DNA recombinase